MYSPRLWPGLSSQLASALSGDPKPLYEGTASPVVLNTSIPAQSFFSADAVLCADTPRLNGSDDKVIDAIVGEMVANVGLNSIVNTAPGTLFCNKWPVVDTGRFVGPFNSRASDLSTLIETIVTTNI